MSEAMNGSDAKKPEAATAREERLAARLRDNLRRRKAQTRALATDPTPALPKTGPES